MSTRVGFYHLTRSALDAALPKLLDRARSAGHKVLVLGSAERVAHLDALLWTFEPASWIAHGTAKDGDAALQPIFLTDKDENPNGADMLVLLDGLTSDRIDSFKRCALVFDGNDGEAVDAARARWAEWKDKGFQLAYHQQTEQGGWEEKSDGECRGQPMTKAATKAPAKAKPKAVPKKKTKAKSDGALPQNTLLGDKHTQEYAEFILDILTPLGPVQMSRMFSGHGFRLDGFNFAMLLRSTLFLRVDAALAADMDKAGAKPFRYSTSKRTVTVASYRGVPEETLDDPDVVVGWAKRAVIAAQMNPKKKKAGKKRSS